MKIFLVILNILLLLYPAVLNAKTNCSKNTVCIETKKIGNMISFYAINKKHHKVSINIDVTMQNMESDISLPLKFVLSRKEKRLIFSLVYGKKKWKYNYHFDWARGDFNTVHNNNYIYGLPYPKGRKFKVSQSCNGSFTHSGHSQYAIDFKMPVDTPVHAAREGLVVDIKEDSSIGGNSKSYIEHSNYIIIEHPDGTLGEYHHVKHNGVIVNLGQYIHKGDLIGYSGNTGYTRGAHLHFIVRTANDVGKSISIPSQFSTNNGIVVCPKKNTYHLN